MADLTGKTLGKYRLLERLGRGGMAEVYRAYQPNLDREVAVKVMHSYMAEDPGFIGRFKREAKAIAALRHPHIVQVYDFDVEEDIYYMVMEYIGGETLKARLERLNAEGRRMSLGETVQILRPLCDALDYAHAQGRIHRDIKPGNVMFDGDRLVLTDFGVATIVGGTRYTAPGTMIGTPVYMSPEQCRGEPGGTHSDFYSLGIVLYEMITGQVPYDADTPLAIVMKHLNDPLPLPRQVVVDLPPTVERVILKALAKSPEDRYQSARELADALEAAVEEVERPTLAEVAMPAVEDMAGPAEVAAAAAALPAEEPLPETIAEPALPKRRVPWVFIGVAVLAVVALGVAALLILPGLFGEGGPSPDALAHYEAGFIAYESWEYERAIHEFTEAITADPGFAEAYHMRGVVRGDAGFPVEAEADLTQAITLKPDMAEAYYARGRLYLFALDRPEEAWTDLTRAIELRPEFAEAYLERARLIQWTGDNDEQALADLTRALDLNPGLVEALHMRADIYLFWEEYDLALADATRAIELLPEDSYGHFLLGFIYYSQGEYEKAAAGYGEGLNFEPDDLDLYFARGMAYLEMDDLDAALQDFHRVLLLDVGHSGAHYGRGRAYVALGNFEEAVVEFTAVVQDVSGAYRWPFFEDESPYVDRAQAFYALGMLPEALADLSAAIEEDPYWHLPYYYRGLVNKELGQVDAAIADFKTLWEIAPDEMWRTTAEEELRALQSP